MRRLSRFIDKIIKAQAEATSLLMVLLVVLMATEVFLRYVLESPTVWGLEFTTFLYGMHFVMGYGYTEQFHGHVNVDIVSARLPVRVQQAMYIVTTLGLSLPVSVLLCIWSYDNAWASVRTFERSPSAWNPPIWPVKIFMAIGFTFLVLQIISNLIKKIVEFSAKSSEADEVTP